MSALVSMRAAACLVSAALSATWRLCRATSCALRLTCVTVFPPFDLDGALPMRNNARAPRQFSRSAAAGEGESPRSVGRHLAAPAVSKPQAGALRLRYGVSGGRDMTVYALAQLTIHDRALYGRYQS